MAKHKEIYIEFFQIGEQDYIPCECGCGKRAVDVHHISKRGMGGSKYKDMIFNLAGLARDCHTKADKDILFNERIREMHERKVVAYALANPKHVERFLKKYPENKPYF